MADPFSVVSGACGVFSLGMTICSGIIDYCSAVNGADEEVDRIARKATRMQNTMHLLENILRDNQALIERDYADPLHQMVEIIRAGIDILQEAVKKCWRELQSGNPMQAISRSTAKRALYPFRQKSLLSLSSVLDGLQLELSTAMHMCVLHLIQVNMTKLPLLMR